MSCANPTSTELAAGTTNELELEVEGSDDPPSASPNVAPMSTRTTAPSPSTIAVPRDPHRCNRPGAVAGDDPDVAAGVDTIPVGSDPDPSWSVISAAGLRRRR